MTIRQLLMLRHISVNPKTQKSALKLDQRIFGSICYHHWVEYSYDKDGNGFFTISEAGMDELEMVQTISNYRSTNNGRFAIRTQELLHQRVANKRIIEFRKQRRKTA